MGAFLDKPKTDKTNEHGAGNGLRYGVSSMQGWRVEMEDAHRALTGLGADLKDWSFFAVSFASHVQNGMCHRSITKVYFSISFRYLMAMLEHEFLLIVLNIF